MIHQQLASPVTYTCTLPPSGPFHSARLPYRSLRLLLAAMMAVLISLVGLAAISPALLARTQAAALPEGSTLPARAETAGLSASTAPGPLLNKPELVQLRSEYANHYDLGNGRRLAVVGATPLNYQDAQGNWLPIQPGFAQVEGGWRVAHNTLRSTFANDSTAVQLESAGQVIGWQPVALEVDDGASRARQLAVPLPGEAVQAEGGNCHERIVRVGGGIDNAQEVRRGGVPRF